ncbi:MAG TPA: hypothetical protein DCZ91_06960 [Lachnospiraceae bacterium]|nr:hypothetical protein [Lachnospiraceae bacterium]
MVSFWYKLFMRSSLTQIIKRRNYNGNEEFEEDGFGGGSRIGNQRAGRDAGECGGKKLGSFKLWDTGGCFVMDRSKKQL